MQSRRPKRHVAESLHVVIPPASADDPFVTVLASMAAQSTPQGGGFMNLRNGWRAAVAAATVVLVAVGGAYAAGAITAPDNEQAPVTNTDTDSPDAPDEVENEQPAEPEQTLVPEDDDADDQGEDADEQGEDADEQGEDADDQGEDADDQGEDADDQGDDADEQSEDVDTDDDADSDDSGSGSSDDDSGDDSGSDGDSGDGGDD